MLYSIIWHTAAGENMKAITKISGVSDILVMIARLITSFVFRQFWRRSNQNQLSFSGNDSTADFFVFRHFDEKQKSKNEMKSSKMSFEIK